MTRSFVKHPWLARAAVISLALPTPRKPPRMLASASGKPCRRALLRVGGGLHLHLKQRFEGAIDPGKSQVYQMVEALLTPPPSTPLETLLDQPFASAFNHPPPQR